MRQYAAYSFYIFYFLRFVGFFLSSFFSSQSPSDDWRVSFICTVLYSFLFFVVCAQKPTTAPRHTAFLRFLFSPLPPPPLCLCRVRKLHRKVVVVNCLSLYPPFVTVGSAAFAAAFALFSFFLSLSFVSKTVSCYLLPPSRRIFLHTSDLTICPCFSPNVHPPYAHPHVQIVFHADLGVNDLHQPPEDP